METSAVQLQGCLLTHFLHSIKNVGERGGDGVAFHIGVGTHEGIDVQALGHGLSPADIVASPEGIALFLRHNGAVGDLAFAAAVFVNDGVHAHIGFVARGDEHS